jgi:hypothetical protein
MGWAMLELVFFVLEQEVEGGHGTVAAGDILLHFDLLGVTEFIVAIDLLFQNAQVVAHHDNLMEKGLQGDFFALQGGISRVHY